MTMIHDEGGSLTHFRFVPLFAPWTFAPFSTSSLAPLYMPFKHSRTFVTSFTDSFQPSKSTSPTSSPNLALHHNNGNSTKNIPLGPGFRSALQSMSCALFVFCLRAFSWRLHHHAFQSLPRLFASPVHKLVHPEPDIFRPLLNHSLSSFGLHALVGKRLS